MTTYTSMMDSIYNQDTVDVGLNEETIETIEGKRYIDELTLSEER